MTLKLPRQQQRLYDTLAGKGDVPWGDLYEVLTGARPGAAIHPARYISPYVTRLNRRLADRGLAVRPGDKKGTLRLTVT